MYDELITEIKALLKHKNTVVIAISGHGGSGKSTLSEEIAKAFGVEENQIIRLDNLYAKNYEKSKSLFELSDWPTIYKLLSGIHKSKRLKYKTRNWEGVEGIVDVPMPRLVIIEGIRLLRPETKPLFDLSIWIDCPLEFASNRAKERNRKQGDSEAEIALWDSKWIPESKKYSQQIHPEQMADFIYKDYMR